MTELRIRCCIPGCQHTTTAARGFAEWICAAHWRLIPVKARRIWHRSCRQAKAGRRPCHAERGDRLWSYLRRVATARAAGDLVEQLDELFGWGDAA